MSNEAAGVTREVDVIPPARVSDLRAPYRTGTSFQVTWTASGDDAFQGTAARYDLRYATQPDHPWELMTPVEGEPTPSPGGTGEVLLVGGFDPETTYYLRIRVVDEAGNWSLEGPELEARTVRSGEVVGTAYGRITWTASESPYIISESGDGQLGVSGTLVIEPGVEVRGRLTVSGEILAQGTPEAPIRFTDGRVHFTEGASPGRVDAEGDYASGSIMRHCIFDGTWTTCLAAPIYVDCEFRNVRDNGALWLQETDPQPQTLLIRCLFEENNGLTPVRSTGQRNLVLRQCVIRNNTTGGFRAPGAVSVERAGSRLTIENSEITGNQTGVWGTVTVLGSSLTMTCTSLSDNRVSEDGGIPRLGGIYIAAGITNPVTVSVRHCNISGNEGGGVYLHNSPFNPDMRDNWWGMTDRTLIDFNIKDCTELPETGCVTFEPFRSDPVDPAQCP